MHAFIPSLIPSKSALITLSLPVKKLDYFEEVAKQHSIHIAVDGGLDNFNAVGIHPDYWLGDGDSKTSEIPASCKSIHYSPEKDDSDFKLALEHVLKLSPNRITVFGGLGGRIDHTISNLYTASTSNVPIVFEGDEEHLFFCPKGISIQTIPGQRISLIPLSKCQEVSTRNLKWELNKATLNENFFSLSNEACTNTVEISHSKGLLIISIERVKGAQ